ARGLGRQGRGAEERHDERALLPGTLPRPPGHARRPHRRGAGAGRGRPGGAGRELRRCQAGHLLHGHGQGEVPQAGGARGPARPRGGAAAEGRGGLEDPRRGQGGGAGRLRGRIAGHHREGMMRALAALALVACSSSSGPEELKLGKRSRDAGPAVVIVDRITDRATGPTMDEKEPNDAKSGGQAVTLPLRLKGRIDAADAWDVSKLTVATAGTLRVTLSGVDDADLVLEVQSSTGELLAVSDNGPAKVAEAIPNLFVQPGTVNLVVHEYRKPAPKPKKGQKAPPASPARTGPSQPYFLEATLGPPPLPGEEREPNNEAAFASDIS